MKKLRNSILKQLQVPMTDGQEAGYMQLCAGQILRYEKFFLLAIMVFQLYNIIYVFLYTNGKFHTTSSRVYTVLYVVLLLVSSVILALSGYLKKRLPGSAKTAIILQVFYGTFLLLWGGCVTVYDQRVSENLSVYFIISLSVAIMVYYKPIQAFLIYSVFEALIIGFLPLFRDQTRDSYGEIVNLTVMTLMCIFISVYRNRYERRNYLYRQIIGEKNAQLRRLANYDALTGLRNRRFLEEEMGDLYKRCSDGNVPVTFMMIDIDSFKTYNDRFSHLQGDECLRRVAWRIQNELNGEKEYLIRFGGEEFLYIGLEVDEAAAKQKAARINQIVRELIIGPSDREPMGVTVSVGAYTALWKESAKTIEWVDCVNEADKALYLAKNRGKDQCVCFSECAEGTV